jgi:hypothetical protein
MTRGQIALAVVSLAAVALSGVQLWSLWRTGQPLFQSRRALARANHRLAFALNVASNIVVLAAAAALFVWALAG